MVAMRLTRIGSKKTSVLSDCVIDKRRARNGRFLEVLGQYNPIANPASRWRSTRIVRSTGFPRVPTIGNSAEPSSKKEIVK